LNEFNSLIILLGSLTKGDKENSRKFGSILLSVILLLSISFVFSNSAFAQSAPTIALNDSEFVPGDIVEITGSGLDSGHSYDIYIIRPDGWVVKNDGESGVDSVVSDENGFFQYSYPLVSVDGTYLVRIFDSSDEFRESKIVSTTFHNSAPVLRTDKVDYDPEDTVIITGNGFSPGSYDIVIIRPDGSIIKGDGITPGFDTVGISDGIFVYDHILNGIPGEYSVNAYDSTDAEHLFSISKVGFYDDTSSKNPTSYTNDAGFPWDTPGGATDGNNSCAVGDNPNDEIILSGFGFAIPSGATINSITVTADSARSQSGKEMDYTIQKAGADGATISLDPSGSDCPGSTLETVGTSLWGFTWTAEEINSNLTLKITRGAGGGDGFIDGIQIEVDYTPSGGGGDVTEPDTIIDTNPTDPTNDATPTFTFHGDDGAGSGIAIFECRVDADAFAACTSGDSFGPLTDGSHTFEVRAIDNASNTDSTPASYTWLVDLVPPVFDPISDPIVYVDDDGKVYYDLPTATDNHDISPEVVCIPPSGSELPIGETEINCTATDDAGNQSLISFNVRVVPQSLFSSGGFETEGIESLRLIYTNDPENISVYRLTASNPGQQFLSLFVIGTPGDSVEIDVEVPQPFETQGSNPYSAYADFEVIDGAFVPLGDKVPVSGAPSTISYETGTTKTITLTGEIPDTGLYWIVLHFDYGLKKESGYVSDNDNNALHSLEIAKNVEDDKTYQFVFDSIDGPYSDGTLDTSSFNDFKKVRGIAVFVTYDGFTPASDITVKYVGPDSSDDSNTEPETGITFFEFKHKGKAAEYVVSLPDYPGIPSQSEILKANDYAFFEFNLEMSPP